MWVEGKVPTFANVNYISHNERLRLLFCVDWFIDFQIDENDIKMEDETLYDKSLMGGYETGI